MESASRYFRSYEIVAHEHDWASSDIEPRAMYHIFRCDCGRVLDEIRMKHEGGPARRVMLVARKAGIYRHPPQSEYNRLTPAADTSHWERRPGRRHAVRRSWTKRGRRWVCPCGQDWQRLTWRIFEAMMEAAAKRPAGPRGDTAPQIVLGVDL